MGEGGASKDEAWLAPGERSMGRLRLLCLPHAGAGGALYYGWRRVLPEFVEVCPILLPGRERRLGEPCATRLDGLLDRMVNGLRRATDGPYAIFGHSMGALLAYELALRLEARGERGPAHLFVSGRMAPQLPPGSRSLHLMPEEAFLTALQERYGAMPGEILADPEMRAMFLPILRADLELIETHVDRGGPGVRCGITAMAGAKDRSVSRGALEAWQTQTRGGFEARWFAGDHFYLSGEGRGDLLSYLAQRLGEMAGAAERIEPGWPDAG